MKSKLLPLICFLSISCPAFFAQKTEGEPKLRISTPDEIQSEFNSVPCKNGDRLAAVKSLFEKMGAKPEEIRVEKAWGVENLVVRRPAANGVSDKIVIGAHYDKVADGCGALDNWTGVVTVAHLYRTLKDVPLKKNFVFVAFGQEEKGLLGSSGMAADIKKEQIADYCAMVNIDSLGLGIPQAADNMSNPKLVVFVEGLAKEMNIPFAHGAIAGGDSDSTPFNRRKIPAITIHALTSDWPKILHGNKDQPSSVNSQSVYAGYRLSLVLLARLDESDCQAFREGKEKK